MSKAAKKRFKRYAAEGRCRRCTLPPLEGKIHCETHDRKAKDESKKAVARFIKKRRDNEECVTCGKPSKTYNCVGCRKKLRKKLKVRHES